MFYILAGPYVLMAASGINTQFLIAFVNVFIALILMKHLRTEGTLTIAMVMLVTFGSGKAIETDKKE